MQRVSKLLTGSIPVKLGKLKKLRRPARRVSRPSRVSGMRSFRQAGFPATVSAFCGGLKTTFFHGWASGPSRRSKRPSCFQSCGESKAGARWKRLTGLCRTADRFFAMRWRPDELSAILPAIFVVHYPHPRKRTTPRSSIRNVSPNCSAQSMLIRVTSRRNARYD